MANLLYLLGIASAVTAVLWVLRRTKSPPGAQRQLKLPTNQSLISQKLVEALPHIVLSHSDKDAFRKSIDSYWAQQEREVRQACIVQPREASEVASVINILKREHGRQRPSTGGCDDVLFAVRGGGQSPVPGGASAKGGVLIDLTLMREVTVSDDRESVALGAGTRWVDVLRLLDREGLTAVGGRSSDVGVAGYTLGGQITVPRRCVSADHLYRRDILFHTSLRPGVFKCPRLRSCSCVREHRHGHRPVTFRPLACPERRLKQLRRCHALYGAMFSVNKDLERIFVRPQFSVSQGNRSLP